MLDFRVKTFLTVCETMNFTRAADRLHVTQPAVSQHLTILENAGLVTSEKRGQFVHYSLAPDQLANTLNAYAQEVCPVSKPLKTESATIARSRKATDRT